MNSADKPKDPTASIVRARALAEAATKQARVVRETADQLLEASRRVATTPSEVIGGLIGAAISISASVVVLGGLSASAVVIPFVGVAGLGIGILCVRGRRGVIQDRDLRGRTLAFEERTMRLRLLRSEIEAARALGVPMGVEASMWKAYEEILSSTTTISLPPPTPRLALGPGDENKDD
jgi:hypothetical protein